MTQQLAPERPAQASPGPAAITPTGLVAAAAAVRGAAVAVAGLILATGLATLIWAMTPTSGLDVADAMRGGVVGFAAANLMPVDIGGVTLSLPPLMFTLVITALLSSTARRGRFLPEGRYQETISVLMTALVYGVIVAATTRGFGPEGAVGPQWVWTAPVIALVATSLAMLQPGSSWHEWCRGALPVWLRSGVRGGAVGLGVLLAGGGLAVTVGLISHFGDAVGVSTFAAPSSLDGLGLLLLGVAYLPNAVIAAAGYVAGVGFEVGPGTYSPFAVVPVDLPAVPLLAAVPDAGRVWTGLIFLVVPVTAGYLVARVAIRRLATRADRTLAAGVGALLTGGLLAGAVAIARGGVGDGRWSMMGAQPLLVAAAVAVEVGVIAVLFAGLTQSSAVPWRAVSTSPEAVDGRSDAGIESAADAVSTGRRRRSKRSARAAAGDSATGDSPDGESAAGDLVTGQPTVARTAEDPAAVSDPAVVDLTVADPTVNDPTVADSSVADPGAGLPPVTGRRPATERRPATGLDRSSRRRWRLRRNRSSAQMPKAAAAVTVAASNESALADTAVSDAAVSDAALSGAAGPDLTQPDSSGAPETAEPPAPASADVASGANSNDWADSSEPAESPTSSTDGNRPEHAQSGTID